MTRRARVAVCSWANRAHEDEWVIRSVGTYYDVSTNRDVGLRAAG